MRQPPIPKVTITFRPASTHDAETILFWRESQEPGVSYGANMEWLKGWLRDKEKKLYVVSLESGDIGVVALPNYGLFAKEWRSVSSGVVFRALLAGALGAKT